MLMHFPGIHACSSPADTVTDWTPRNKVRQKQTRDLNPTKESSEPMTLYVALTSWQTIAPEMEWKIVPGDMKNCAKPKCKMMEWLEKSDTKPPWDVVAP